MQRTFWLLSLLVWPLTSGICQEPRTPDPERYKSEIMLFRRFDARNSIPSRPILFIGSSSIVHWETAKAFPEYPVVNRGFGGSVFPDLLFYYDDIVKHYDPAIVVVYCDNDVRNGRSAEKTLQDFKELSGRIFKDFPRARIVYLTMKPTPLIDAAMLKSLEDANTLFKAFADSQPKISYVDIATPMLESNGKVKSDIFLSDGEHLNAHGYETIWNPIVKKQLAKLYK